MSRLDQAKEQIGYMKPWLLVSHGPTASGWLVLGAFVLGAALTHRCDRIVVMVNVLIFPWMLGVGAAFIWMALDAARHGS